jgi:hypothetical protein
MGGNCSNLPELSSGRAEAFTGIRTTEIEVTYDESDKSDVTCPSPTYGRAEKGSIAMNRYSITITSPDRVVQAPTRLPNMLPRSSNMDRIKWAYTKVAILFAVSIFVTWVPSSVNRVHGLRYPQDPSYFLNISSALVLPLQGFWNTIIYFTTSLSVCRGVWARFRGGQDNTGGCRVLHASHRTRDNELAGAIEMSVNRSRTQATDS